MEKIKKQIFNSKLFTELYSAILCAYSLVYDRFIKDNYFLIINLGIHFFVVFITGGLESVNLDIMQKAIGLLIFCFLTWLNFKFFSYYIKEVTKQILKNKNPNSRLKIKYTVFQGKPNIYIPWILSNLKFSILIFVLGCFYNKGLIPGIVYLFNLDPDFQLAFLFILLIVTPQVGIIVYFLNSGRWLSKFYFVCYLIILRWILIIIILLFVSGYNLEFSMCLFLLLSTGMFSIFLEIDIFMELNVIFKALFSNIFNSFINYIEIMIYYYGKLICSYSGRALPGYKFIKVGHNSKIPFYLKKEVIDSQINLKVKVQTQNNIVIVKAQAINNIARVTIRTRYIPSIIDFNTKKILISRIILEVIDCNEKSCYKLLGGASSSGSNLNRLIFPSEPLLSGNPTLPANQTFFQYLVEGRDNGIFSDKFIDFFFNDQYRPFNRYKNLIINAEHKFILSLFSSLFIEQNNLFCFSVNIGGTLVPIPYKKIFYNDKPDLSLYKLIGIFENETDMVTESDLYINEKKADHWVGGFILNHQKNEKIWKSYSHVEELENFPTYFSNNTFSSLEVCIQNRYWKYNPNIGYHDRRDLFMLIDGKRSKLPFQSPRYLDKNIIDHLNGLKHGDKIKSFFMPSNSLLSIEE